jgi:hypothetical protein
MGSTRFRLASTPGILRKAPRLRYATAAVDLSPGLRMSCAPCPTKAAGASLLYLPPYSPVQSHRERLRRAHLRDFVDAYNFARRLKTLKGLTPYEFICKAWTSQPQRFKISPIHKTPGLNS